MTASKIASFQACVTTIKPSVHTTFEKGTLTHLLPIGDPAPCVTILVHGVNDVGEAYQAQEEGLCLGLNERLFRKDLAAGLYKLPKPDRSDPLVADPDAVYYQRALSDRLYTPVIPFYWGFREEEGRIRKKEKHGQKTDRRGNRLDARGIKNGGPFANATSSIPDMWTDGMALGFLNLLAGDPTHPILKGPPRTYMVLAAQRLAMLIRLIRDASADDTVNIVAHSQGCLVSLLAQAFLQADGERPADCLILNHPPYSLHETLLETTEQALDLQTVQARLDTLVNLVKTVTNQTHAQPVFGGNAFQRDPNKPNFAICGKGWKAAQDRDNRGKVYLYFSPDDEVVGFSKVQGIGWQGVPDQVKSRLADSSSRMLPGLQAFGERFKQRVFTSRHRDGKPQLVGMPLHTYMLCTKKEAPVFWISGAPHTAAPPVDQTRTINGEALPSPCTPQMGGGRVAIGPLDAATAITNDGIRKRAPELLNDPRPPEARQSLGRSVSNYLRPFLQIV